VGYPVVHESRPAPNIWRFAELAISRAREPLYPGAATHAVREEGASVRTIKLVLATVGAAAAMLAAMLSAAAPAAADHGWEWTAWWQWEGSPWWCSSGWFHDENDEWNLEAIFCYDTETGEVWTGP
jgi:hypothetical protein